MTDTFDVLTFPHDRVTLDLLLWRAYGKETAGLVEDTLARNPGLADLGVFPPRGTQVRVKAPSAGDPPATRPLIRIY